MQFTPDKIHPSLCQVLRKIEEKHGKEIGFLSCDHLTKSTTIKKDEDKSALSPVPVAQHNQILDDPKQVNFLKNFYGGKQLKLEEDNNNHEEKNPPISLAAQRDQDFYDAKQVQFLKRFYGDRKLDPNKVHPSLLQKLKMIEQKDEGKNYFLEDVPIQHYSSSMTNSSKDLLSLCNTYWVDVVFHLSPHKSCILLLTQYTMFLYNFQYI